ncbi:MAG: Rnase Y domain-containing protein, partial [Armatimonadota bacterium]|nr:Rnase Y domain-containing protein [Armatimonadota bacterium]
MPNILHWLLLLLAALGAAIGVYFLHAAQRQKLTELRLGLQKEEEALRSQQERADKDAETRQKELLLEAREEAHRLRGELEQENKEKRAELLRQERKIIQREEALDEKLGVLDSQREALSVQERAAQSHLQEVWDLKEQQKAQLQQVAGLTTDEAKT